MSQVSKISVCCSPSWHLYDTTHVIFELYTSCVMRFESRLDTWRPVNREFLGWTIPLSTPTALFSPIHSLVLSLVSVFHTVMPLMRLPRVSWFWSLSYSVEGRQKPSLPVYCFHKSSGLGTVLHIMGSMDRRGRVNSLCDLALMIQRCLWTLYGTDTDRTKGHGLRVATDAKLSAIHWIALGRASVL